MNDRPYLSPVVKGWKQRQAIAEAKQINGQSREDRNRIAEIRRRHREREEEQARKQAQGIETERPAEPEPTQPPPEPENAADEPASEPDGDSMPDPADMDRDALIAELQSAGEKVHPASKDATLRRKVRELR